MATNDTLLCGVCGITLRPFMTRCPRCGAVQDRVPPPPPVRFEPVAPQTPFRPPAEPYPQQPLPPPPAQPLSAQPLPPRPATPPSQPPQAAPQPAQPLFAPMDELRRRAAQQADAPHAFDTIALSPPDEVRRFPLFTQAQLMLLLVGLGLLLIGLVIAYLLWSRDRTDAGLTLSAPPAAGLPGTLPSFLPETSPTFDPNATPTPALSNDDQALLEEAKKVLAAYNPTGVANYKLAIKDGVVTLNGSAEHAPEKEGATNVLRLVAGIKQVVNNLNVKADSPLPTASLTPTPVVAGVNPPATAPTATPAEANPPANNAAAEAEAERLRRELEASRQREAELQRQRDAAEQQRQRDAEAQRQRDADEAARRQQQQEENRRQEAERAPTRPRRAETDPLRSGTVAWSGVVDGVDEIVIGGSSAAVRHVSGDAVRDARASFSAAVPRAPVGVKLLSTSGRGTIQIVQEPSAANGYTTIVRIDDSPQHGGQTHQFTLRWSQQ